MKISFYILAICLFFTVPFTACQQTGERKMAASAEAKRYDLTGTVISIDRAARKARIEHDEIKGYMPAMAMNFPIKQNWVFEELKPGHKVSGVMVVQPDGDYFLDEVAISAAPADMKNVSEPAKQAPSERIGQTMPDFPLTNQDNKRINTTDFRGKTLVLTFIFTRCPDPEFCPRMSINMSDLEKQLRANPDLKDRVRLLSITFDPAYDKPEVLKKYGAAYFGKDAPANFDIWQLATGSETEVKAIADYFGVNTIRENERLVHNLRTAVIAPDGKVLKLYSGGDWTPADVLRDINIK
jgi:protein SCO1